MQQQLQQLLETLSHTEPHYIRCVKPNNVLKPAIFENKNVLQQLRCGVRGCYLQIPFFSHVVLKVPALMYGLNSGRHGGNQN